MAKYLTGALIKKYRTAQSKSQQAIADELGVARSYISEIESGKKIPTIQAFNSIMAGLGFTAEQTAAAYPIVLDDVKRRWLNGHAQHSADA